RSARFRLAGAGSGALGVAHGTHRALRARPGFVSRTRRGQTLALRWLASPALDAAAPGARDVFRFVPGHDPRTRFAAARFPLPCTSFEGAAHDARERAGRTLQSERARRFARRELPPRFGSARRPRGRFLDSPAAAVL